MIEKKARGCDTRELFIRACEEAILPFVPQQGAEMRIICMWADTKWWMRLPNPHEQRIF